MIIFWGFQNFQIYLAKYFWSLLSYHNLICRTTFLQEQCKQNGLISFFIMQKVYESYNYHTF